VYPEQIEGPARVIRGRLFLCAPPGEARFRPSFRRKPESLNADAGENRRRLCSWMPDQVRHDEDARGSAAMFCQ
jgi:hypothetical protein